MTGILLYDNGATIPGTSAYPIFTGLRNLGYSVTSPGNVQEALQLLEGGEYAIALVNLKPRVGRSTGLPVARLIREHYPSTQVVVYGTKNPLFYVLLRLFDVDFWPSGSSGPVDLEKRMEEMNGCSEIPVK